MKKILIADANKASLVMTSEVFKDHFPGVQVVVARSSSECLSLVKSTNDVDAFIVDFDLPDQDGAATAAQIKKHCPTPVLITAFDREDVYQAIHTEVAAYDDCQNWLRKPVKAETLVSVATRFVEGKYRTHRRIGCKIPIMARVQIVVSLKVEVCAPEKTVTVKANPKNTKNKNPLKSPISKIVTQKVTLSKSKSKKAPVSAGKLKKDSLTARKTQKEPLSANKSKKAKSMAARLKVPVDSKQKPRSPQKNLKAASNEKSPKAQAVHQEQSAGQVTFVTKEIRQEVLIPGYIVDSSICGIRVVLKFAEILGDLQRSKAGKFEKMHIEVQSGNTLEFFIPSEDVLADPSPEKYEAWVADWNNPESPQKTAAKSKSVTLAGVSPSAMQASKAQSKTAFKTEVTRCQAKGTVCWLTESEEGTMSMGLRLADADTAKKLFDAALCRLVPTDRALFAESSRSTTIMSISSLRMPQRNSGYSGSGKN